jgi:hypothetical protein
MRECDQSFTIARKSVPVLAMDQTIDRKSPDARDVAFFGPKADVTNAAVSAVGARGDRDSRYCVSAPNSKSLSGNEANIMRCTDK